MGALSAFMYFLTVSLCMPTSRAIPRMDSPLRFAFCTAFHLAVCSGVGFLGRVVTVLRTRAAPLRQTSSRSLSASSIVPNGATSSSDLLMTTVGVAAGTSRVNGPRAEAAEDTRPWRCLLGGDGTPFVLN